MFRYAVDRLQEKPAFVLEFAPHQFEFSRDGKFLVWANSHTSTLRWYDANAAPMKQLGEWKMFAPSTSIQIAPDSRHVYTLRIADR